MFALTLVALAFQAYTLSSYAQQQTPLSATPQAASAENLRCEYLSNPLSVDATQPRLNWTIAASGRGWMQSA